MNGRLIGSTPVTVKDVSPGTVVVEVFNPKLPFSRKESFSVTAGDNGVRRFEIRKGSINFRIRPYATVVLDGKTLGQTPLAPVEVYEGRHTLTPINRELGKEVHAEYVVQGGESHVYKADLLN